MKILLVGYGKMGRLVEELAPVNGCEVAGRIDAGHGEIPTCGFHERQLEASLFKAPRVGEQARQQGALDVLERHVTALLEAGDRLPEATLRSR